MTDAELLRRYAEDRSEEAFAELVRRRVNFVYSAARRQAGGDSHLAEDITQEVFSDLARQARALCRRPAVMGWLYTATRFAAAKRVRTEQRRRRREQEAYTMQENIVDPGHDPDWQRLRPLLDRVMHQLKDRDRQLLLLRFFNQSSLAEVGEELNVSPNAAQKGVDRALEKLRALLAKHGVTSSAAAIALFLSQQTMTAAPASLAGAVTSHALGGVALAGGTTAYALNFLQLMNTMKLTVGIVAATLLMTVAGTVQNLRAIRGTEAALETARQSLAATAERVQDLRQRGSVAGNQALPPPRGAPVAAVPASPAQAADPGVAAGRALQSAHPEINQAVVNYSKAAALARYWPLFSQLKLTPDQIAQFEQIAVAADPGGFGFGGNGYQYSFSPSDHPISQAEAAAQVQALLGPAGFQALQDYQRTAGAVSFANMVGEAAFDAGEPISATQSDQLRQIVAANSATYVAGRSVNIGQVDWTAVEQQSRSLLTDGQAASLSASIQQLQFNQAWTAATRQAADESPTH
jgi:RNA polymerase sigma factor (sigma-70 family)